MVYSWVWPVRGTCERHEASSDYQRPLLHWVALSIQLSSPASCDHDLPASHYPVVLPDPANGLKNTPLLDHPHISKSAGIICFLLVYQQEDEKVTCCYLSKPPFRLPSFVYKTLSGGQVQDDALPQLYHCGRTREGPLPDTELALWALRLNYICPAILCSSGPMQVTVQ